MYQLSKKILTVVTSISFCMGATFAQAQIPNDILDIDNSSIGQWIKDGPAIKEYPVCYQIWKCVSDKPTMGESVSLPIGEWGLCDNYVDITQNNICTKCDAPPPIEVCE